MAASGSSRQWHVLGNVFRPKEGFTDEQVKGVKLNFGPEGVRVGAKSLPEQELRPFTAPAPRGQPPPSHLFSLLA